jgi:Zn-dependent hydrolases, including glyoxylases
LDNNILIESFVVGPLETNCYLVGDRASGQACLIDPGADAAAIKRRLRQNALELKFIINTHGHGDHIAANRDFDVPIYIHRLDGDFLTDPSLNLSKMFMFGITSPKAERLLEDKDRIILGNLELEIIHTPGHTPGSISIKVNGVVFTGDALFAGGIGRTDFAYGDGAQLIKSITENLFSLDDETIIYPGHGPMSTIAREKRSNPFLRDA